MICHYIRCISNNYLSRHLSTFLINTHAPYKGHAKYFMGCLLYICAPDLQSVYRGSQWLSSTVLDSRSRGCGFEPYLRHCVVSLSKTLYPLLSQEDWDVKNQNKQSVQWCNFVWMKNIVDPDQLAS